MLEDLVVRSELSNKSGDGGVSETRRIFRSAAVSEHDRKSDGASRIARDGIPQLTPVRFASLQFIPPDQVRLVADRFMITAYIFKYLHSSPGPGVAYYY